MEEATPQMSMLSTRSGCGDPAQSSLPFLGCHPHPETVATDCGVLAPPGGVFWESRVQAPGHSHPASLASKALSPAGACVSTRASVGMGGLSRSHPEICCLQGVASSGLSSSRGGDPTTSFCMEGNLRTRRIWNFPCLLCRHGEWEGQEEQFWRK